MNKRKLAEIIAALQELSMKLGDLKNPDKNPEIEDCLDSASASVQDAIEELEDVEAMLP